MEEKKTVGFLKGKPIIAIEMAAAALIAFGITWAYYTSKQALANPLTTAHSGAAIVEEYNPNSSFLPGETVIKKVAFQNTGKMDIFLRVEVLPEEGWYNAGGQKAEGLETVKVEKQWTDEWGGVKILEAGNQTEESDGMPGEIYGEETETDDWTKAYQDTNQKWYRYYKKVLSAGETTADILKSIKLSNSVTNDRHGLDYSDKHYRLTFNAEAVPVEDHGGQLGQSSWNMSVSLNNDGSLTWTQVPSQSDGQSN